MSRKPDKEGGLGLGCNFQTMLGTSLLFGGTNITVAIKGFYCQVNLGDTVRCKSAFTLAGLFGSLNQRLRSQRGEKYL